MELGHALVKVTQHGIELVEGDGRDAGVEGGDERLVVDVEAVENVRDQFVVLDRLACGGEFIGEAAEGG